MAVLAVAFVGGAIGAWAGAALGVGASLGFGIGWAVGSYVGNQLFAPDAPRIEGPRLVDSGIPAGAEGAGIPIVRGTMRVKCQVIWDNGITETTHEEEVGGKGGPPSATQVSYSYTWSAAVLIADGAPSGITGVRQVWLDSKLAFSISENAAPATFFQNQSNGTFRIYTGTETQTADPFMESILGVGNVPAYRGTAYMVIENLGLEDYGRHRPFVEVELVYSGPVTYPKKSKTSGASYAFSRNALDTLRRRMILGKSGSYTAGEYLYTWKGGDDTPVPFYRLTADFANSANGLTYNPDLDQVILFGGYPAGNEHWEIWDASTGVSLSTGQLGVTGLYPPLGTSEAVECRSRLH